MRRLHPEPLAKVRPLAFSLLALVLGFGIYIRASDLGAWDFSSDAMNHVYAAESLLKTGQQLLPSGEPYVRGPELTQMVAWSLSLFNLEPEVAARLPALVFGILDVLLFAAICYALGGVWVALWGTLLFSVYPELVLQTRSVRFYSYQLFFGLLAMYTGWRALNSSCRAERASLAEVFASWRWAILTLILFAVAAHVQLTTLSIVAGWACCILAAAMVDGILHGWVSLRRSFAVQAACAGVALLIMAAALYPSGIDHLLEKTHFVPYWAGGGPQDPRSYYWFLSLAFPLVISLLPVICVGALMRNWRASCYLIFWFFVPFILHSFVFWWKEERYIMLAVPALLLLTAFALSSAAQLLYENVLSRTIVRLSERAAHLISGGVVAVASLAIIFTTPGFNTSRKLAFAPNPYDFRGLHRLLAENPELERLPLGSSAPLRTLYYTGRIDFVVQRGRLERPASTKPGQQLAPVRAFEEGSPDYYSGRPVLATPEAIRSRYSSDVLVVIADNHWRSITIDGELRKVLSSEAKELCHGTCRGLSVFRWNPAAVHVALSDDASGAADTPFYRVP